MYVYIYTHTYICIYYTLAHQCLRINVCANMHVEVCDKNTTGTCHSCVACIYT